MQKLVLLVLACLLAFAAAVDVAVETETAVDALSTDFEAQVQSAIDAQSDESVAESEADVEAEAADEAEGELEADDEAEEEVTAEEQEAVFLEADADEEVDESDLAALDALDEAVDNAEAEAETSDEFAAEADAESLEQLEAEVAEVAEETDTFEQAVDSTDESSFLEASAYDASSYDEVAADTMMEGGVSPAAGEDMRLAQAQAQQKGIGKLLGNAAKAGLNAAAKAAGKVIGSAVGKAAVKLGKKVVEKAVKVVKKVAKKLANSKLGKAIGKAGKKLLGKAKKLAKKAIKAGKKIIKKLLGKKQKKHAKKGHKVMCKDGTFSKAGGKQGACSHHGGVCKSGKCGKKHKKKHHKKHHKKHPKKHHGKCPKGPHGKKCRIAKCKAHKLGCRFKCARGGWSRRHHHHHKACRTLGGVHPNWSDFDLPASENRDLDIKEGVINPDGTPGPFAEHHPDPPIPGIGGHPDGLNAVVPPAAPAASSSPELGGSSSSQWVPAHIAANGDEHNRVVEVGPAGRKGWNGVNPRYKGQPDLPPVKRLPEDVEDCVACQYVWKQVEQDVGNSAITQTIYDSFHANALEAQRTPIFYPACQTMFDAADDMIGDYMDGFTVDQICENSMLCRPRDLNQFLKHQRRTKGI